MAYLVGIGFLQWVLASIGPVLGRFLRGRFALSAPMAFGYVAVFHGVTGLLAILAGLMLFPGSVLAGGYGARDVQFWQGMGQVVALAIFIHALWMSWRERQSLMALHRPSEGKKSGGAIPAGRKPATAKGSRKRH